MQLDQLKIAVLGLGYVGLPLAVEFGNKRPVVGFDIDKDRIAELGSGYDSTKEVDSDDLQAARHLTFSSDPVDLNSCGIFIVTVPTPIDRTNRPDLDPLKSATKTVATAIKKGAVVIYESTVYPGCTEEVCVPILEQGSDLKFNQDFFVGYSPERANPGDREHRLTTIVKVTSGSNSEATEAIDALYASIVTAGTHMASSIRVAEAAKVIENTQRDLNIALMNELSLIFNRLNIDTNEVLAAAATKWNFLPFRPGLVGGHCIGVDPYYLTHKAQEIGYHPEVILAGRRINDGMGQFVADQMVKLLAQRNFPVAGSRILVMGLTFKENCPDVRNTRVVDIIAALKDYNVDVNVFDPWIDIDAARRELGIENIVTEPEHGHYDGIVVAVAHREFIGSGIDHIRGFGKPNAVLYDVKSVFPRESVDGRL